MSEPKIILWDLETSNLSANFGKIISFGWKELGSKKVTVASLLNSKSSFKKGIISDKELVSYAHSILSQADAWVTYYGRKFDVPFLNTRLIRHDLNVLPDVKHIDVWFTSKFKLKLNSNRLKSVTEFLGVHEKTPVVGEIWNNAVTGHRPSIKYINEHCYHDVIALEDVYYKLRPLLLQHPNSNFFTGIEGSCPICSSPNIEKRGRQLVAKKIHQRLHCKNCGKWFNGEVL